MEDSSPPYLLSQTLVFVPSNTLPYLYIKRFLYPQTRYLSVSQTLVFVPSNCFCMSNIGFCTLKHVILSVSQRLVSVSSNTFPLVQRYPIRNPVVANPSETEATAGEMIRMIVFHQMRAAEVTRLFVYSSPLESSTSNPLGMRKRKSKLWDLQRVKY